MQEKRPALLVSLSIQIVWLLLGLWALSYGLSSGSTLWTVIGGVSVGLTVWSLIWIAWRRQPYWW